MPVRGQCPCRARRRWRARPPCPRSVPITTDGRTAYRRWLYRRRDSAVKRRSPLCRRGGDGLAPRRGMTLKHKDIEKLFRVPSNGRVRLKDWDPQWAGGDQFRELKKDELKARAETFLKANLEELAAAQEVLWAT